MRLIDADAFKDMLNRGGGESVEINISKSMEPGEIVDIVIQAYRKCLFAELDKMPIAYDVYKVVELLRAELRIADDEKERCARENQLQFGAARGYAHGVSVSLKIVRSGGIESLNESGEPIGKSMLVFDTPKGCAMCPAFQDDPDANPNFTYYCGAARKYMNYRECYDMPNASVVRPDWCPIIEAR